MSSPFRYFEHPYQFSTYRVEPRPCDLCGEERPGFAGPFTGEDDAEHVCEGCLLAGRLAEAGMSTNEGDLAALRAQIEQRHPELSAEDARAREQERTVELEQRTPHWVSWQDHFWPAHCGDYCRYIKEIGRPELQQLAPEGDVISFLQEHATDVEDERMARDVWESIRPDVPQDGSVAYSVGVYLFRCLICDEPILMWDSE
jgi:uncharacterized protein CbrC (UPF0167 family)